MDQSKRGSLSNNKRLTQMAGNINANDTDKIMHHHPGDKVEDDNFGFADEDWDIYRSMNRVEYMGYEEEDEED